MYYTGNTAIAAFVLAAGYITGVSATPVPPNPYKTDLLTYVPPTACAAHFDRCLTEVKNVALSRPVCLASLEKLCESLTDEDTRIEAVRVAQHAAIIYQPLFENFARAMPKCASCFGKCLAHAESPDAEHFFECLKATRPVCRRERVAFESSNEHDQAIEHEVLPEHDELVKHHGPPEGADIPAGPDSFQTLENPDHAPETRDIHLGPEIPHAPQDKHLRFEVDFPPELRFYCPPMSPRLGVEIMKIFCFSMYVSDEKRDKSATVDGEFNDYLHVQTCTI
jgi:hypothetical protein